MKAWDGGVVVRLGVAVVTVERVLPPPSLIYDDLFSTSSRLGERTRNGVYARLRICVARLEWRGDRATGFERDGVSARGLRDAGHFCVGFSARRGLLIVSIKEHDGICYY